MQIKAEIITIGDEILIGQTIDTNSAWLAEELHLLGIRLHRIVSISDTAQEIQAALDESFSRADLVLMTGGLGPTRDDVTKQTLADYFSTVLVMNREVHDEIEAFFKSRGREMLDSNSKQAELPKDATILKNKRGTAMGMWFEKGPKVLLAMPGVPYEMKGIMHDYGLEKIKNHFRTEPIIHKTVLTQGIGESFLAQKIESWEDRLRMDGLALAYLPSPGMVKLRISGFANAGNGAAIAQKMDGYIAELEQMLPAYIFGREKDTVAESLGKLLQSRSQSLAAAESCTGGFIAHLITAVPGSSQHFLGSVVAYSNASKSTLLHVEPAVLLEHGAISEKVVTQMAQNVRKIFNSTYAISTSGVAGPDGGDEQNPVGTIWMAIASAEKTIAKRMNFGRSRSRNITISALTVLNWLRNEIINNSLE